MAIPLDGAGVAAGGERAAAPPPLLRLVRTLHNTIVIANKNIKLSAILCNNLYSAISALLSIDDKNMGSGRAGPGKHKTE